MAGWKIHKDEKHAVDGNEPIDDNRQPDENFTWMKIAPIDGEG